MSVFSVIIPGNLLARRRGRLAGTPGTHTAKRKRERKRGREREGGHGYPTRDREPRTSEVEVLQPRWATILRTSFVLRLPPTRFCLPSVIL